jgi:hypothetical protein
MIVAPLTEEDYNDVARIYLEGIATGIALLKTASDMSGHKCIDYYRPSCLRSRSGRFLLPSRRVSPDTCSK